MARLSSSGAARRPRPSQNIGKASSHSKPTGQRKLRAPNVGNKEPRIASRGRDYLPKAQSVRSAPARSNAGGAVRGQARAAQVKAMNAAKPKPSQAKAAPASKPKAASTPKGPTHGSKVSRAARLQRKGMVIDSRSGGVYYNRGPKAGQLVRGGSSAPAAAVKPKGRSAGFNPFGVPAKTILDSIINSKRKR